MPSQAAATDALEHLCRDSALAAVIEHEGAWQLPAPSLESTFEALARSIVHQQLSGRAAGTIYRRFVERFGDGARSDSRRVAAAELPELRAVGLSRRKGEYIQALARADRSGELPTPEALATLDDEAIVSALVGFRGIGRWTVEMLLMGWLGRRDVLPVDDLGIRRGVQVIDGLRELPDAPALLARAEGWRPWRSVACWYLWRAAEPGWPHRD